MYCPSDVTDVTDHSVLGKLYKSNLLLLQLYTNNVSIKCYEESRDSSVGIATDYGLAARSSIPGRANIFFFSIASRPPPVQWVPGAIFS
jgi:hypothetical protein